MSRGEEPNRIYLLAPAAAAGGKETAQVAQGGKNITYFCQYLI